MIRSYYVFYKIARRKVGISHDSINSWRNLITNSSFHCTPDVVTASPGLVSIVTGVGYDTDIAIEGVEKAVCLTGQPEPCIPCFYSKFPGRLQVKSNFGALMFS